MPSKTVIPTPPQGPTFSQRTRPKSASSNLGRQNRMEQTNGVRTVMSPQEKQEAAEQVHPYISGGSKNRSSSAHRARKVYTGATNTESSKGNSNAKYSLREAWTDNTQNLAQHYDHSDDHSRAESVQSSDIDPNSRALNSKLSTHQILGRRSSKQLEQYFDNGAKNRGYTQTQSAREKIKELDGKNERLLIKLASLQKGLNHANTQLERYKNVYGDKNMKDHVKENKHLKEENSEQAEIIRQQQAKIEKLEKENREKAPDTLVDTINSQQSKILLLEEEGIKMNKKSQKNTRRLGEELAVFQRENDTLRKENYGLNSALQALQKPSIPLATIMSEQSIESSEDDISIEGDSSIEVERSLKNSALKTHSGKKGGNSIYDYSPATQFTPSGLKVWEGRNTSSAKPNRNPQLPTSGRRSANLSSTGGRNIVDRGSK